MSPFKHLDHEPKLNSNQNQQKVLFYPKFQPAQIPIYPVVPIIISVEAIITFVNISFMRQVIQK